jgi:Protein of unknown function (DUF1036)
MALYFQNRYSNTVWIAFLYYDRNCRETPFTKMGWWQVNSAQIFNGWNVDLRAVNRYAAFFAEASDGVTWSGTGNNWYLISESRFSQCYDDNTNCNMQPDFVPLDFNGFYDVNVVLGPGAGKLDIKGLAPKKPPK